MEVCTVAEARRRLTELVDALEAGRLESVLILARGKVVAALVKRPGEQEWERNRKGWLAVRRRGRPAAQEPDSTPWWTVSEARKEFAELLDLIATDYYPAILLGRSGRYEPVAMIPPGWVRNQILERRPRSLLERLLPV